MAVASPSLLARSQFRIGFTAQTEWVWLITAAFFCGSLGAGLFLVSFVVDFSAGALAGVLIVGVLKTTAHVLFLGKPLRAWRAIFAWRTSWISRGVIAMGVFLVCGFVYVLPYLGVSSLEGSTVAEVFGWVAVVAAVVLMVYDGFVMKTSRGIPLWTTWLMPLLTLCYGLLGGATLTLLLRRATGEDFSTTGVEALEIAVLAVNFLLVAAFVMRARSAAARVGVHLLTRGSLSLPFLFGAVCVGLVGTLVLAVVALATGSATVLALAAATELAGDFMLFFCVLRAGVYAPIRPLPVLARG